MPFVAFDIGKGPNEEMSMNNVDREPLKGLRGGWRRRKLKLNAVNPRDILANQRYQALT